MFLDNMEESGFIPRYGNAADTLELADLVCVHFNRGGTMPELIALVSPGATMPESEFRAFAAMSAVGFCPEH
ncbi:hypothetical protein ACQ1ZK_15885, partial [Enterococcus faecium]